MTEPYPNMLQNYRRMLDGDLDASLTEAVVIPDPIGVGAVGGSGTRLMATMLETAGVVGASPLNRAGDAMEWPPWDIFLSDEMLTRYPRDLLVNNLLYGFERLLEFRRDRLGLSGRSSWKVPGTYFWLRELAGYFPKLQYIHLIRNGLDMAYSGNESQALGWASHLDVELEYTEAGKLTPGSKLEYWLRANEHALALGEELLGDRMLLVRYEDLCARPAETARRVVDFLCIEVSSATLDEMIGLVKAPPSVGRYRRYKWRTHVTEGQLERLEKLGYIIE